MTALPLPSPAPSTGQSRRPYVLQPQPSIQPAMFSFTLLLWLVHTRVLFFPVKLPFCGSLWIIFLSYERESCGNLVMSI